MLSVSEQLQRYRAQQARKSSALNAHMHSVMQHHPTTRDYFQSLMKRWQQAGTKTTETASENQR